MKKKKDPPRGPGVLCRAVLPPPRWNTQLLYLRKFGRLPDLKHPQTLNEKLLRQKLERFGTDPVVRRCADKYRVRDYVAGCGCGGTLNRLLAVYDRPEDIDWDALPERFAVKWNFGCGYNLICTEKSALDTAAAESSCAPGGANRSGRTTPSSSTATLRKSCSWRSTSAVRTARCRRTINFTASTAGQIVLCSAWGRDEGWPKFYFFDRDFRLLRINRDSQAAPEGFTLPKPAGLDEAFAIADRLSKPFDFVRVDLYLTPRGVRFGELTFTPAAALDNKRLPETDLRFGRMMEETL